MEGIPICVVCGKDIRICQHTADEFYEARIKELQRQLEAVHEGYSALYAWSIQKRRERVEMKQRIRHLEMKNGSLRARLYKATHEPVEE